MRKVYQSERNVTGLLAAVAFGACFTALLFCILPFAHQVANPQRTLELRKAGAVDLPPPVEDNVTPPPEPETEQESEPDPQLAEALPQMPLSADLEVAEGSGGALAGFAETFRSLATADSVAESEQAAEFDQRPEAVSQVPPTYPPELARAKIGGKVQLQVKIGEDGRVEDVRVGSSTRPEFERPAIDAVRKWRFRPPTRDGKPAAGFVLIPLSFSPPKS